MGKEIVKEFATEIVGKSPDGEIIKFGHLYKMFRAWQVYRAYPGYVPKPAFKEVLLGMGFDIYRGEGNQVLIRGIEAYPEPFMHLLEENVKPSVEVFKEFKNEVLYDTPSTDIDSVDFFIVFKLWKQGKGYAGFIGRHEFNRTMKSMGYTIESGSRTRLTIRDVSPRIGLTTGRNK